MIEHSSAILTTDTNGFTLYCVESVDSVPLEADALIDDNHIFLSREYLRCFESAPPPGMGFYYVVVQRDGRTVGLLYFQLLYFNAAESLNYEGQREPRGLRKISEGLRKFVAEKVQFHTVVSGNVTITGYPGFVFDRSVDDTSKGRILDSTLTALRDCLNKEGYDVRLAFVKDYYRPFEALAATGKRATRYNRFEAQPSMVINIREHWNTMDDYLADLTSKYRVRYRRARKRLPGLEHREFTLNDVERLQDKLYGFYRDIADKATFNLFYLHQNYFHSLKEHLGKKCRIFGYYESGELKAFYSLIFNGDELVAHFLGYDDDFNRERQAYLNILYNIIEFAIIHKFRTVNLARTAMEIKSSVGAEAHPMLFYLRYYNGLHNKLLPVYYDYLEPEVEWEARNPFKS